MQERWPKRYGAGVGGDYRYRGEYAECYVTALAIAAGLNVYHSHIDDDGVDLLIRHSGDEIDGPRSPGVEIQVKTWQPPDGDREDHWTYRGLSGKRYNHLVSRPDDFFDRYLVVLAVPDDRGAYVRRASDGLVFRDRAYYARVPGPAVESGRSSVPVVIAKADLLTIASLRSLIHPDLNGREIAP